MELFPTSLLEVALLSWLGALFCDLFHIKEWKYTFLGAFLCTFIGAMAAWGAFLAFSEKTSLEQPVKLIFYAAILSVISLILRGVFYFKPIAPSKRINWLISFVLVGLSSWALDLIVIAI